MYVKRAFTTFWTWYIEIPKSWKNKEIFKKKIQKSYTNLINAKECFGFTNLSLKSRPLNKIMTKQ